MEVHITYIHTHYWTVMYPCKLFVNRFLHSRIHYRHNIHPYTNLSCLSELSGDALPCVRHEATWAGVGARDWFLSVLLYGTSQSAPSRRRQFASEPDGGGPGAASLSAACRCLRAEAGHAERRTGLKFTSDGGAWPPDAPLRPTGAPGGRGHVGFSRAGELGVTFCCYTHPCPKGSL